MQTRQRLWWRMPPRCQAEWLGWAVVGPTAAMAEVAAAGAWQVVAALRVAAVAVATVAAA